MLTISRHAPGTVMSGPQAIGAGTAAGPGCRAHGFIRLTWAHCGHRATGDRGAAASAGSAADGDFPLDSMAAFSMAAGTLAGASTAAIGTMEITGITEMSITSPMSTIFITTTAHAAPTGSMRTSSTGPDLGASMARAAGRIL